MYAATLRALYNGRNDLYTDKFDFHTFRECLSDFADGTYNNLSNHPLYDQMILDDATIRYLTCLSTIYDTGVIQTGLDDKDVSVDVVELAVLGNDYVHHDVNGETVFDVLLQTVDDSKSDVVSAFVCDYMNSYDDKQRSGSFYIGF